MAATREQRHEREEAGGRRVVHGAIAGRIAETIAERRTAGRDARTRSPRSAHADWSPAVDRAGPVALLEAQSATRLREYVPIRYGRMLASPFAFLRGSAVVMAADLAGTPTSGITVQASGDAHLLNFGVFGTPERNLVFGMNDFDETLRGPWEWDVKRLAASVVVAGRDLGFSATQCSDAASGAVESYGARMDEFAELGHLELRYRFLSSDEIVAALTPEIRARAEVMMQKARSRTNLQVLDKTTELIDGDFRIVESPPLIVRPESRPGERAAVEVLGEWLEGYRASLASDRRALLDQYRIVDAVRKVVGVGSVGTRCHVVLLRGVSERDPLFLQVKEAGRSVLEPYVAAGRYTYQGRRVVEGQRLLQAAPDIFLGWGRLTHRDGVTLDYYVRQLRDMKGSVEPVRGVTKVTGFTQYAGLCGWALALAHARSGDAARIAGYLGRSDTFAKAVARFAVAYADQTERDHAALVEAARTGRIEAQADA
jgi:uncharacterized protein (DUF2252 family)